jgi:hypothetical protein
MILVARISDEDAGVASSMFNAGQQVGGAVGLAVIGTIAWTAINSRLRNAVGHLAAGPAGDSTRTAAIARPGSPVYNQALSSGVSDALAIGAGAALLALAVTLATIRIRRADLPSAPPVI